MLLRLDLARQLLERLEEARDLLQKALASDEKSFEPGHPSIAHSQSNLAKNQELHRINCLLTAHSFGNKIEPAFLFALLTSSRELR